MWSQRAEWKVVPAKVSRPGMSGSLGSLSVPVAVTSTLAVSSPRLVRTRQRCASGSQLAPSSSVPRLIGMRSSAATSCR